MFESVSDVHAGGCQYRPTITENVRYFIDTKSYTLRGHRTIPTAHTDLVK